jgi:hypothetical protein
MIMVQAIGCYATGKGELETLIASADLNDATDRLMLSDEMEAAGRMAEANALRDESLTCVVVDGLVCGLDEAEAFFWGQYSHTDAFLRLRYAQRLAEAEEWFCRAEGPAVTRYAEWVEDNDADRSWLNPCDDRPIFGCILWHGDYNTSLWSIDLGRTGDDDDYRRVVEAELALELMGE